MLLIFLATLAAAAFGYGMDARWGEYAHGLDYIVLARKYQWLSAALSIVFCVATIFLVASGKRRAWWLVGLLPVLLLFFHRFSGPAANASVLDNPTFVTVDHANFVKDSDWVVGLTFNSTSYAYPFTTLFDSPVVLQVDRGKDNHLKRLLVMWSPYANRATAFLTRAELRPRTLDIVSTPANATLVYNTRRGEFINAITGQTLKGEMPQGFISQVQTVKMPFGDWKALHPDTQVLSPPSGQRSDSPSAPLAPLMKMPKTKVPPDAERRIVLIAATQPTAIPQEAITASPANVIAGVTPILLFRDSHTNRITAFSRLLEEDQPARFSISTDKKLKGDLIDDVTHSGWTIAGTELRATDGPAAKKKKTMATIAFESDLPWGVIKVWYPSLELLNVPPPPPVVKPPIASPPVRGRR